MKNLSKAELRKCKLFLAVILAFILVFWLLVYFDAGLRAIFTVSAFFITFLIVKLIYLQVDD